MRDLLAAEQLAALFNPADQLNYVDDTFDRLGWGGATARLKRGARAASLMV